MSGSPTGLRPGERATDYRQLTIRLPDETLAALTRIGKSGWAADGGLMGGRRGGLARRGGPLRERSASGSSPAPAGAVRTSSRHPSPLRHAVDHLHRRDTGCVIAAEPPPRRESRCRTAPFQPQRPDALRRLRNPGESDPRVRESALTIAMGSLCAGGWICEAHRDQPWPHDECAGPGIRCTDPDCPW